MSIKGVHWPAEGSASSRSPSSSTRTSSKNWSTWISIISRFSTNYSWMKIWLLTKWNILFTIIIVSYDLLPRSPVISESPKLLSNLKEVFTYFRKQSNGSSRCHSLPTELVIKEFRSVDCSSTLLLPTVQKYYCQRNYSSEMILNFKDNSRIFNQRLNCSGQCPKFEGWWQKISLWNVCDFCFIWLNDVGMERSYSFDS